MRGGIFVLLLCTLGLTAEAMTCDQALSHLHAQAPTLQLLAQRLAARSQPGARFPNLERVLREGAPGDHIVTDGNIRVHVVIVDTGNTLSITFVALQSRNLAVGQSSGAANFALARMFDVVARATAERVARQPERERPSRVIFRSDIVLHPDLRNMLLRMGLHPEPSPMDNMARAQLARIGWLMAAPFHAWGAMRDPANTQSSWATLAHYMARAWDAPNVRSYRMTLYLPIAPRTFVE